MGGASEEGVETLQEVGVAQQQVNHDHQQCAQTHEQHGVATNGTTIAHSTRVGDGGWWW